MPGPRMPAGAAYERAFPPGIARRMGTTGVRTPGTYLSGAGPG
ncbi:hypothetical protein FAGKG844_80134 [Frankia sp. AgKG'84/4]